MASDEATSKIRPARAAEYRSGTDTELLSIGGEPAELFVLCGERSEAARAFRSGDLSVHIIRVSGSPVAMVGCMVGDHHWMLAKDSTALRVGRRAFVFALPGLLFGLALHGGCSDEQLKKLEEIFMRFCAYQDLALKQESESEDPKPVTEIWASIDCSDWSLEHLAAHNAGNFSTFSDPGTQAAKIQRAVRTSAVVKLVSRALLSGALSPTVHLHLSAPAGRSHGVAANALPSMWAVADLLDAIETGGWLGVQPRPAAAGRRAPEGCDGCWYLNREGIARLLDIVRAYGAANARVKKPRLDVVEEEADGEGSDVTVGGREHEEVVAVPGGAASEVIGNGLCGGGGRGDEVGKQMGTCKNS